MKKNNPVLIVEHCTSGLSKVDESQIQDRKDYILSGTFTEFNVRNRNDRIYTADKFLPHLNELLERKEQLGVLYGEFDHPDVFDTSLKRVSHTVIDAKYEQSNNTIQGSIKLLNTNWGKEAKALVDDGLPIFVSSRAAGITEGNGEVNLKKLFTYDAVADPGFASAKMSLNESLGFNEGANFRIYDVTDESKINELFTMDKNDMVTKQQMEQYSEYLTNEMAKVRDELGKVSKEGTYEPEKIDKLSEYYENLHESFNKVSKYLDYLAENVQILVNENNDLKTKTDNLVKHNDYLAENLNRSIQYSDYLAEKLDKSIDYSEYIAETLSSSIDFSEYIAENVDKNIKYSEYLAESLDKTIDYSEYLAENVDKNIEYSNYLAENLDNSIAYSEYLAENVDSNIAYSEYIAENLDNSIKYGEYIAEHVDNSIAYSEYIAENLSDTQAYTNYLSESLDKTIDYMKDGKLNEENETEERIGDLKVDNVDKYYEDEEAPEGEDVQKTIQVQDEEGQTQTQTQPDEEGQTQTQPDEEETGIVAGVTVKVDDDRTGEVLAVNSQKGIVVVQLDETEETVEVQESRVSFLGDKILEDQNSLKKNIENLIAESKKRKASEDREPHFLLFLSEKNKAHWAKLSDEDKEKVVVAMNESKYASEADVMKIMQKTLNKNEKTFEQVLVEKVPEDLKETWDRIDTKIQESILAQARLYNLNSDEKIESFWNSRGLDEYQKTQTKKTINENKKFVDNSKLSDDELDKFISTFKQLK